MTGTLRAVAVPVVARMLREAFDGPPGPWTYFTEAAPGVGVFTTLNGVTAAQASEPGGPSQSTIAGHVHHLCSSISLSTRELDGESPPRDRGQSWNVARVNDAEWTALRARLRDEYQKLLRAVETRALWDEDTLGMAMGSVAHTAYHLGAIRQRLRAP